MDKNQQKEGSNVLFRCCWVAIYQNLDADLSFSTRGFDLCPLLEAIYTATCPLGVCFLCCPEIGGCLFLGGWKCIISMANQSEACGLSIVWRRSVSQRVRYGRLHCTMYNQQTISLVPCSKLEVYSYNTIIMYIPFTFRHRRWGLWQGGVSLPARARWGWRELWSQCGCPGWTACLHTQTSSDQIQTTATDSEQ